MIHKYVRHSSIGFILWPKTDFLWHSHIGDVLFKHARGHIISAGFVRILDGDIACFGMSESLGIVSKPEEDTEALKKQLGLY